MSANRDVVEPFYRAASTLAEDTTAKGLEAAAIALATLRDEEVPLDLRGRYMALMERLPLSEGRTRAMSPEERREAAKEIFSLFLAVNGGLIGGK